LGSQISSRINYTTPSYAPVYIPSSGLQVSGHALLTTLNVSGSGALGGSLSVADNASFGNAKDTNTTFNVYSDATFHEAASFNKAVSASSFSASSLSISGNGTISGTLSAATTTLSNLVVSGNATTTNATTTGSFYSGQLSVGSLGSEYWFPSARGNTGQILKTDANGILTWQADTGGSGGSTLWATSTDELLVYPADTSDVVVIGGSATTSEGYIFEVIGDSLFDNATTSGSLYIAGTASTTELFVQGDGHIGGNLTVDGDVTGNNLNISHWDTAYGWGDHSLAGYLTNLNDETLGSIGDVSTSSLAYGHLLTWDGSNWQDNATSSLKINSDDLVEGVTNLLPPLGLAI